MEHEIGYRVTVLPC